MPASAAGQFSPAAVQPGFYRSLGNAQHLGNLPVLHFLQISQNDRLAQFRRKFRQRALQQFAGLAAGERGVRAASMP